MKLGRCSGVLLHPSSLPGGCGIGDLGEEAKRFVDFLAAAHCSLWQVLPLGPTGFGGSPYQSFSAIAGNPSLIALGPLVADGMLAPEDLQGAPLGAERADLGRVASWKAERFARAWERFEAHGAPGLRDQLRAFEASASSWLGPYALFMAIKEANGGGSWSEWPAPLRRREPRAIEEAGRAHAGAVRRCVFEQWLFFRQWRELRAHAASRGVRIIGDLPIFVAHDSADVWARPELFQLDEERQPTVVAGVPPDYFSPTGQLWGNPLYRWDAHEAEGFAWWIERIRSILSMVDVVRLDHFRGFAAAWEVPASHTTAERGTWAPGPGARLLDAVRGALGDLPLIAEDLGDITEDVLALRDRFALPGMKVLQFAFSGPDNPFLPHVHERRCVVYTGTHDNDTVLGWFQTAPEAARRFCLEYLASDGRAIVADFLRAAWSSVADVAIAPMQDLLGLGSEARMNLPGSIGGNWTWRMRAGAADGALAARLRELNRIYGRATPSGSNPR